MITTEITLFSPQEINAAAAVVCKLDLDEIDIDTAIKMREQLRAVFKRPVFFMSKDIDLSLMSLDELKDLHRYINNLINHTEMENFGNPLD
jgi:hypothetical protein